MDRLALVDLDNTLAGYGKAWSAALEKRGIAPGSEVSDELETKIRSEPGFWLDLEPVAVGFEVCRVLESRGYELHILSKGPKNAPNGWSEKFEWVRRHLGPDIGITISSRKDHVRGACLVEDWPKYLGPWMESNPDKFGILIDYDWNRDYQHDRVIRVGSEILTPDGLSNFRTKLGRLSRNFNMENLSDEEATNYYLASEGRVRGVPSLTYVP